MSGHRRGAMDEGHLWSWLRTALGRGANIQADSTHQNWGYEKRSAHLDAAASDQAVDLWSRLNRLQPMDTAPTDRPIVAYCKHSADPGPDEDGRLSLYMGHAEGLSHVEDGWHVLVWGGAWDDRSLEDPGAGWMPDWWFANDGTFEVAANPIGWLLALPNVEPAAP